VGGPTLNPILMTQVLVSNRDMKKIKDRIKKVISPSAEPKNLFLGKKIFFWVQRWVKLNQSLNQIKIR